MCNQKALENQAMKKKCYDNFVNETHRNIDESNHGGKTSCKLQQTEKVEERAQIKNYEPDNA